MVLAALVLFAGSALALSRPECISSNAVGLAAFSACGQHDSLTRCLANLPAHSVHDVQACFVDAGCSNDEALVEARYTLDRCDEWARAGELRKRYRAFAAPLPARTASPNPAADGTSPNPRATAAAVPLHFLFGRQNPSSTDCFVTSTVDTTSCDLQTSKGIIHTLSCSDAKAVLSECAPGLTCTMDRQGNDVCMELQDALDTAGIIITVIFGSALLLGIGSLTFLCCKDRKLQKRLAAKAEATALARAATKKQRANEVRTPLIRQQDPSGAATSPVVTGPPGGNDPFGDQNRA
ncbi:hypothetical protein HJFPF1_06895 [Paramyrothecium foliicola]|nr:hypothetical protein HJFPF1_06895 [Paramyrothecium foliicola]